MFIEMLNPIVNPNLFQEITMKLFQSLLVKVVSPLVLIVTFAANAGGGYGYKKDIVDVAASNSDFTTLVAAVKAAGLVSRKA